MKIWPDAIYVKRKLPKIKLTFDKKSKFRPAWIWVQGISGKRKAVFLRVKVGKLEKLEYYRTYLSPKLPLYIPVNYTPDEMQKYYDKFSELYDPHVYENNISAIKFLISKLKAPKTVKILDLGAGTGIASEQLIANGYKDITLVDFSEKMLAKAKKKKLLKGCKFIRQDIRKMKLKNKFDLIVSVFSFAYSTYFKESEMPILWRQVAQQLKPKGTLAIFGHNYEPPTKLFKKIRAGTYLLAERWEMPYYIGVKR